MHWKCPKIGFFDDFGGENWNVYLSRPQGAPPWTKTRVLTYHSPKSVHGFDQGAMPRNTKNNGVGDHLGFSTFLIFEHRALFGVRLRLCMPNFVMIGLTVRKLLTVLVFHTKCIESAQNLGFGYFGGENLKFRFLDPKRHLLGPKHAFWRITRQNRSTDLTRARCRGTQKIMASAAILDFQLFWFLIIGHFLGFALDSAYQIS